MSGLAVAGASQRALAQLICRTSGASRGFLSSSAVKYFSSFSATPTASTLLPRNSALFRSQRFPVGLQSFSRPTAAFLTGSRHFASKPKPSMDLIKKLRVRANAGVLECKNALTEVLEQENPPADEAGILRAAVDILRQRGIAKASSKSNRVANEGLVCVALDNQETPGFGSRATLIEINCETDFVSGTEAFRGMCSQVSGIVQRLMPSAGPAASAETLAALQVPRDLLPDLQDSAQAPGTEGGEESQTLKDFVGAKVIEFGENLTLRRAGSLSVESDSGIIASYVHNRADLEKQFPDLGMGRHVGVVALEAPSLGLEQRQELAKALAIHVVAAESRYLTREDVPESEVEHEKNILVKQLEESGSVDKFLDRKIEGRMRKYFEETCLMEQAMVAPEFGGSKAPSVAQYLSKKAGKDARITGFLRYEVGTQ